MSYEAKARDLVTKANKKLKGWGMFGNKYEDAVELLEQAANQFKLAKACKPPDIFAPTRCFSPFPTPLLLLLLARERGCRDPDSASRHPREAGQQA